MYRYIYICDDFTPCIYDTCSFVHLSYGSIDARRKNATRESTNTLKAWLYEHRKNPYPTKGEKIMLAILTKMTLTQVSTWFANARRRLKKDCRTSWDSESKSLNGEDGDDDDVIGAADDVIGGDDDVDVERDEGDERTVLQGDNGSTDGTIHSPEREEDRLEGIICLIISFDGI